MPNDRLQRYRKSIDNIDTALICLLAERFKITSDVSYYKAEKQLPPADLAREAEQTTRLRHLAESAGLNPDFAEGFLRMVIEEATRHHRLIRDELQKNGSN
ncbi:MAG: chorismate mutase [Zymomonas mobilis subsp. pomaceae]|uniref:chorismate mutase n=1 Tax=Zymomonas mobilis subsp. pomaceae (strain ATCC 29192 / DSM 22645 / JCM 10191 / CCUG 17912 / NBRC 13757 / NCIMB 11200 / NRRL B-4491 / Barker I) TaxID=579138 RepID=F8ERY1_ZYMMT|nr:chorismate mutase [Zymomonas mobilis]AEI37556.1 chorismate mutase [Zymomonas mobilis subsp. pomaceae ATCC 29192]MDX5948924.1 chorismate mutase [Zymomonas mobilis subsp. pomaceae]GEB88729.1 chorismate mutase [Zymomonas mobilis subsp. pomaceae]